MQGQEYLNQISDENRPVKKSRRGILNSRFFIVGMAGLIALIIIIIIGSILSNRNNSEKNLNFALKLRLDNTAAIISDYQPKVKSSDLRSSSASLASVLSNTSRDLTDYLTAKYEYKDSDINKILTEEANLSKDELEADLFEAKINGNLDRIYAHKMAYEVSLIMSQENRLINMTKNEALKELLTSSYKSLENLYENFNSFSEAK